MKYDFDEIIDRSGTYSTKYDTQPKNAPPGLLPLWIADMDFGCPEPVLEAIRRRVDKKILGYTINNSDRVKNAICSWFSHRHSWDIDKSWIFCCPGLITAISLLLLCLSEEGDGVIIQNPVYHPFPRKIKINGRNVVNSPLIRQGSRYIMDYENLEKKFADPKNKGMIFCSPHNPVGRVWTEEELLKLVSIAKKYNKWIIADEIHCDITRSGKKHIPLLKAAPEYREKIITCLASSKTFNIAGLKYCNIVVPNPEYQEKWIDISDSKTTITEDCNPLSMEATVAAYTECEEWLDQALEYIDANFKYVDKYLKENLPKATLTESDGTYLAWVDLNAYCNDPIKLEYTLLNDAKVFVSQGYTFGEEGKGFVRINLATPKSIVAECLERMKKALLNLL